MVEFTKAKYSDRVLTLLATEALRRLLEANAPALRQIAETALSALEKLELVKPADKTDTPT